MKKIISICLLLLLSLSACKKDKTPQSEKDETIIANYLNKNSIIATPTGSGLYYHVDSLGTGAHPNLNSTVTVAYKGYLTDGQVFDESPLAGITFALKNVINGWQEGIPLFKKNGAGSLFIPSALGYGAQGSGSIPKDAVLIFEVHLIDIK